jgi:hypothetical protein
VIGGDPLRRTDVLVTDGRHKQLAIELQHTSISLDQIEARAADYARRDIAQLWIPFINTKAFVNAQRSGSGLIIRRYPARPFERWIHGFSLGSSLLYHTISPALYRGKMKGHLIEVEESEWHSEGGEMQSGGGYSHWSKRWRELTLAGPYQVDKLKVGIHHRPATTMSHYSWPDAEIGDLRP